jgi:hypothetical protein
MRGVIRLFSENPAAVPGNLLLITVAGGIYQGPVGTTLFVFAQFFVPD